VSAGKVLAVCLGPGGVPKAPVDVGVVGELGLEGDKHRFHRHGGPNRAMCLFSIEDCRSLQADGVEAEGPGVYGENLLLEGLAFEELRAGDRLRIGDDVLLELHDIRVPCATLKSIDDRFPELMVGRSGFVCRVVEGGEVRPGQTAEVVPSDKP